VSERIGRMVGTPPGVGQGRTFAALDSCRRIGWPPASLSHRGTPAMACFASREGQTLAVYGKLGAAALWTLTCPRGSWETARAGVVNHARGPRSSIPLPPLQARH
jgi:hypothetical protein